MKRKFHQFRRNGFTLIELLVVVAIIAVLIALLLPALKMARNQARKIADMSNLRQIGYGLELYKNEFNKGPLGFRGWTIRSGSYPADDPLPSSNYAYFGWYSCPTTDRFGRMAYGIGPYIGRKDWQDKGVGYCTNHLGSPGSTTHSAGYSVNWHLGMTAYLGTGISNPEITPILMCGSAGMGQFSYVFIPQNNMWGWGGVEAEVFMGMSSFPHAGSANFLFYDSHVVNQTAMNSIWDYRSKWSFWGTETPQ